MRKLHPTTLRLAMLACLAVGCVGLVYQVMAWLLGLPLIPGPRR